MKRREDNEIDKSVGEEEANEWAQPPDEDLLPNGLPKNYNSIVRPGTPDGNDPNNPVRIYADGVFDMFHIGHAKVLEQAKKLFKHVHLLVGVSGDKETIEKKGKIVMNEKERSEILLHCRWVDEIIMPCPWIVTVPFLRQHNIHYVAHDDEPYGSAGSDDIYYEVKKLGMFRATQRTNGISTSDVINRIIADKDHYIERSLERGYERKEINVSGARFLRIKARRRFEQLQHQLQDFQDQFDHLTPQKAVDKASLQLRDMERQASSMWKKVADQVKKNQTTIVKQTKPVKSTWNRLKDFLCGCQRSKSVGAKGQVNHKIGQRRSFSQMQNGQSDFEQHMTNASQPLRRQSSATQPKANGVAFQDPSQVARRRQSKAEAKQEQKRERLSAGSASMKMNPQ